MPLIVAIEPDRRQATQITAIARSALKSELVVADSTPAALVALGSRVPDLILTSALLSPADEAALADCLRTLDGAGAHVQTLTIPVLAAPGRRASPDEEGGVLGRLRKPSRSRRHVPEGCEPKVFANQIREYLARAEEQRALDAERAKLVEAASGVEETKKTESPEPRADATFDAALTELVESFAAVAEAAAADRATAEATVEGLETMPMAATWPDVEPEPSPEPEPDPEPEPPIAASAEPSPFDALDSPTPEDSESAPADVEMIAPEEDTALDTAEHELRLEVDESEEAAVFDAADARATQEATAFEEAASSEPQESAVFEVVEPSEPTVSDGGDFDLHAFVEALNQLKPWAASSAAATVIAPAPRPIVIDDRPATRGLDLTMALSSHLLFVWPPIEGTPIAADRGEPLDIDLDVEIDLDVDEPPVDARVDAPRHQAAAHADPPSPATSAPDARRAEWSELLDALRREVEHLRHERLQPRSVEPAEPRTASPDAVHDSPRKPKTAKPASKPPGQAGKKASTGNVKLAEAAIAAAGRQKSRMPIPPQDEWGLFDPDQCGFAALVAKLEEITDESL